MTQKTKLNIKDLAIEDRPREKMLMKGVATLSDAELLGIIIASGNKNETAVELSQRILYSVGNNLNALGKLGIKELMRDFKGIGQAKAVTIAAALELGRRRKDSEPLVQPQIISSNDVYQEFHPILGDLGHEEVWMLLLNRANTVIKKVQISKGGINAATTDIRTIMKEAIDWQASAIILCHNHPSGNHLPSSEDDHVTRRLKEAGTIMDIQLLDHIILCDRTYYSYRDKERL